jgi:hypothetical protein
MVATVHTATSDLLWSPHVHALASRGGWDSDGGWHPVPYVDEKAAELLFRQKVISLLSNEGLITPERLELLDSWKAGHTGFSVHSPRGTRIARTPSERRRAQRVKNRVTVCADDGAAVERLARYLLRAPLSLERLELEGAVARYRHKRAKRPADELFDPQDLLARLLMHVPAPRLHVVRYYGHYASAARARRRRSGEDEGEAATTSPKPSDDDPTSSAQRRRLRRQWARMIRRVYEPAKASLGSPARRWGVAKPASSLPPGRPTPVRLRRGHEGDLLLRGLSASDARWPRASARPRFLTDPPVIAQILRHLENRASSTASARAPPEPADRQQLAS